MCRKNERCNCCCHREYLRVEAHIKDKIEDMEDSVGEKITELEKRQRKFFQSMLNDEMDTHARQIYYSLLAMVIDVLGYVQIQSVIWDITKSYPTQHECRRSLPTTLACIA